MEEEVEKLKKENEELKLKIKSISEKREIENECCSNQVNLWKQEVEELQHENEQLKLQLSTKNNTLSFAQSSYDLLKEENKKLRGQVNDWKQRFNSSEKRYADLMTSSCECLELKIKSAQNKVAVEKLEELRGNSHWFCENQIGVDHFNEVLDEILADLKGENK